MKKNKVKKIYIDRIKSRGSYLDIFELGKLKIKRIFSVSNVKKNITRGFHAHKFDTQMIHNFEDHLHCPHPQPSNWNYTIPVEPP